MKRFANYEQAATYSGLSTWTLKKLVQRKALTPYRPIGGCTLLDLSELEDWILSGANAPWTRGRNLHREAVEA
jgi:hypothetical protein